MKGSKISKKSAINASEAGANRLIEASVEVVETARIRRILTFVVPPDINDAKVKEIAYSLLVEQGEGIELPLNAAEGFIFEDSGQNEIVKIEQAEPDAGGYDVVLRPDPSGSVLYKRQGSWGWETFSS